MTFALGVLTGIAFTLAVEFVLLYMAINNKPQTPGGR